MADYEAQRSRCECCGLMRPYLELKFVRVQLHTRLVRGMFVVENKYIHRRECADCREDD